MNIQGWIAIPRSQISGDHNARGFIKVHRTLLTHPIVTQCSAIVLKVWLLCLGQANWQPTKWFDGTKQITVPAGAFIFTQARFAEFCQISRDQLRTALQTLQKLESITIRSTKKDSLLVVENWGAYQASPNLLPPPDPPHVPNASPTLPQQIPHCYKEEEVKKLRRQEERPLALAKPLDEWVELLYARHPKKKDKGLVGIALLSVLEKTTDPESLIVEIDRRHTLWARTNEWTEKNGRFVPSLAQWIEDHGWTQRPDTELPPPKRWVEQD